MNDRETMSRFDSLMAGVIAYCRSVPWHVWVVTLMGLFCVLLAMLAVGLAVLFDSFDVRLWYAALYAGLATGLMGLVSLQTIEAAKE